LSFFIFFSNRLLPGSCWFLWSSSVHTSVWWTCLPIPNSLTWQ